VKNLGEFVRNVLSSKYKNAVIGIEAFSGCTL